VRHKALRSIVVQTKDRDRVFCSRFSVGLAFDSPHVRLVGIINISPTVLFSWSCKKDTMKLLFVLVARVCLYFLWLGGCPSSRSVAAASRTSSDASSSPVRNLEPSLAASQASATAIAFRFQQEAILLVLRSPAANIYRPPLAPTTLSSSGDEASSSSWRGEILSELRVTPVGQQYHTSCLVHFAPAWISLGPHSLCAMTGLASDVEHLVRVLQKDVDTHYNVFDQPMTTHSMVTEGLASTMTNECLSGRRPFGVQGLLIGADDVDPKRTFCVYTIDPSGAWQSWGSGITAIGKYAKIVQEQLARKRQTPITGALTQPKSLREALEHVLDCWVKTCKSQNAIMRVEEEDYQVLVLHKSTGNGRSSAGDADCQLYVVDDDEVRKIVSERMKALTVEAQGS